MNETRDVNVGNKMVKPIRHSGDLKKPERHIFNSNIWTVIPCNDILFMVVSRVFHKKVYRLWTE